LLLVKFLKNWLKIPNLYLKDFLVNFLYKSIQKYASLFPTPQAAKNIAKSIAEYQKAPALSSDKDFREIEKLETSIEECRRRLLEQEINPASALSSKGMQNVNPNIIDILLANLHVIKTNSDLKGYQHYYLIVPGNLDPRETIELDIDNIAGY